MPFQICQRGSSFERRVFSLERNRAEVSHHSQLIRSNVNHLLSWKFISFFWGFVQIGFEGAVAVYCYLSWRRNFVVDWNPTGTFLNYNLTFWVYLRFESCLIFYLLFLFFSDILNFFVPCLDPVFHLVVVLLLRPQLISYLFSDLLLIFFDQTEFLLFFLCNFSQFLCHLGLYFFLLFIDYCLVSSMDGFMVDKKLLWPAVNQRFCRTQLSHLLFLLNSHEIEASCFLSLEVFLPRGELGLALVGRLRMLESAQSNFEFLSERLVRNLLIFHLIFQADCFVLDLEVLISIVFTLFSFDVLDNLLLWGSCLHFVFRYNLQLTFSILQCFFILHFVFLLQRHLLFAALLMH